MGCQRYTSATSTYYLTYKKEGELFVAQVAGVHQRCPASPVGPVIQLTCEVLHVLKAQRRKELKYTFFFIESESSTEVY
jgi:hypothetical protein